MPTNDTTVAAFTAMAPNYEQTVDRELREFWGVGYREFIQRFLGRIRLDDASRVLDIATGMAVVPAALVHERNGCGRVVGVDLTPAMLRGARECLATAGALDRVRLVGGSGMALPFEDGAFDAVTCALATHHMDLPAFLAEVHRVLCPGGQVLVADVALADLWCTGFGRGLLRVLTWWYTRREDPTRTAAEKDSLANMRTPEQWRQEVLTAGFTPIDETIIPARRQWYPPGILLVARANHQYRSVPTWGAQV